MLGDTLHFIFFFLKSQQVHVKFYLGLKKAGEDVEAIVWFYFSKRLLPVPAALLHLSDAHRRFNVATHQVVVETPPSFAAVVWTGLQPSWRIVNSREDVISVK